MLGILPSSACAADGTIGSERQAEMIRLVRNDCGSCHGMTLKGGLGPALLPESLRDKAPEGLRETILRGRTGTAMPPWSAFINEDEANWIVEQLMKGFPDVH
jgi:cytochrome c55X